jgi:hypothetical protein
MKFLKCKVSTSSKARPPTTNTLGQALTHIATVHQRHCSRAPQRFGLGWGAAVLPAFGVDSAAGLAASGDRVRSAETGIATGSGRGFCRSSANVLGSVGDRRLHQARVRGLGWTGVGLADSNEPGAFESAWGAKFETVLS